MSLRTRLVLTVLGLLVIGLGSSVGAIFGALQDWSGDANDDVLSAVGKDFRAELLARGGAPRLRPGGDPGTVTGLWRAGAQRGELPSFFQIRGPDGAVIDTIAYGGAPELPDPLPTTLWPGDGERLATVPGWLVHSSRLTEGGPILLVAMRTAATEELLDRVRNVAVISSLVALALVALLSAHAVRRGLRPLTAISATAAAIGSGDLSRRVAGAGARTEVGRLGTALNAMLAQLETAFAQRGAATERLRRFVGDASHELRTPIATIRGYAELFRRGAASRPDDLALAMRRIESEAERMGVLVDELLLLARLDQGRPLEREPVDLTALAADAVADANTVSGHDFRLDAASPVVVTGDATRLRQVLGNLLDNVRRHTPPGTTATVRVATEAGQAVLTVADTGPGLSKAAQAKVFERFYRGETARAEQDGAGLGLSIVDSVVAGHGGTATVHSGPSGGTTFRITLPLT
ncbi:MULTISPECIES: cell wall metabolism sensor histidine kinase WalK [unclassified Crossiella]|uniref:sensor histidine kinase n=1 Tax=unclassified Crossiella TaxID=2620835 RepID=UPI001FFF1D73|nr:MULTISPECIES: HAMP domain-containing sensor histidine kinase [unclassified Crossiella]MCK2241146.1 HAMP domain-containing histidine kinase [Crossiella sp. S99.2]MCK2253710.1 HAMP domain-containing histidine kinase [Crossiella sp. S99.1]